MESKPIKQYLSKDELVAAYRHPFIICEEIQPGGNDDINVKELGMTLGRCLEDMEKGAKFYMYVKELMILL